MTRRHLLTHREAMAAFWCIMLAIFSLEALAAYHLYFKQEDVYAALAIVTSWFKESIRELVEYFV